MAGKKKGTTHQFAADLTLARRHSAHGTLPFRGEQVLLNPGYTILRHTVLQITLHQGRIESIFLDSMHKHGVNVERPAVPASIKLSANEEELQDPSARPVRVRVARLPFFLQCGPRSEATTSRSKSSTLTMMETSVV